MKKTVKTASHIYARQNRLLHKAFAASGFPYNEDKCVWLKLMTDIAGRPVGGLSGMTLFERHRLINHFQQKGMRLFSPAVPVTIRDWKKGDPDVDYEFRQDDDPQVRMIYAMWAEMGYEAKKLRGLCWKRFKRDDPRWLTNEQLMTLFNIVRARANQMGVAVYHKRGSRFKVHG